MNPIISGLIGFVIVLSSTLVVLNSINPVIQEGSDVAKFNNAKELMSSVDFTIREIMHESTGAKRSVNLNTKDGEFIVSEASDSIKFEFSPDIKLYEKGTRFKEGNMLIISGPFMKAYEEDINSDGVTDLVLENDAVLFAIKKIGNETNPATVDTKGMITIIKNKQSGVESVPISGIYIDGSNEIGQGYTKLTEKGDGILSSSIKVVVNATVYYEAFFDMKTGSDFVELEVRRVT